MIRLCLFSVVALDCWLFIVLATGFWCLGGCGFGCFAGLLVGFAAFV